MNTESSSTSKPCVSNKHQTSAASLPDNGNSPAKSANDKLVVDGMNLIFAGVNQQPNLTKLLVVLVELKRIGSNFICCFDASTYWRLANLPCDRDVKNYNALVREFPDIFVPVPAGKQADDYILAYANRHNLRVVSNDCYREYTDRYPWLKNAPERRIPVLFFGDNYCIEELGIDGQIECHPLEISQRLWGYLDMIKHAKVKALNHFEMATHRMAFA